MGSNPALFQSLLDGDIPSVMPQPVRLASVYLVMSGLGMLTWWHELSILLIYHCISAFALADNLFFPSKLPLWYFKPVIFSLSKCL